MPHNVDAAWAALIAAARLARRTALVAPAAFGVDSKGVLAPLEERADEASLHWDPEGGWTTGAAASAALTGLGSIYLPLAAVNAARPLTVAHLGQSLDGFVATESGDSHYVNGTENLVHLHRMRALSDAVLVGAGTVHSDDPRLTTRLVSGDNPRRVVIDPYGRLPSDHRVFADGAAPTLVVRASDARDAAARQFGQAEILAVPAREGRLDLPALLAALRVRGLHSLFVEGGGVTVSAFLRASLIDRLQLAVAPLLIGDGRPGIRLPACTKLEDCLRPACRLHRMGNDVLFDCDLRARARVSGAGGNGEGPTASI